MFGAEARRDGMFAVGLVLLAVALLVLALSGNGPGTTADSLHYLDTARHIAAGDGVVSALPDDTARPLVTWPPAYPAALAVGPLLGTGVENWAKVLHVALYALLALGAFLLLRWAGLPVIIAGCGATVAAFAGSMLRAFHMALSEALFLPLWLALMALLARSLVDHKWRWLVAAGLCAAAATLTRYVAQGAIVVAALLIALVPSALAWRPRLMRALLFFVCAQLPVLLWLLRNWLVADSVAERDVALETARAGWFFDLWRVATTWFVPEELNRWPRHGLTLALFALFGAGLKGALAGPEASRPRALVLSCAACVLGYLGLMFGAEFGSSRAQDLDQRMMLPVLLPAVLVMAAACPGPARLHRLLAGTLCVLTLVVVLRSAFTVIELDHHGAGYSTPQWQQDLRHELPPGALASNHPEALAWAQGRPCVRVPVLGPDGKALDATRKQNFLRHVAGRPAILVVFDERFPWDAPPELLVQELGLREIARDGGRTVYLMPARPVQ